MTPISLDNQDFREFFKKQTLEAYIHKSSHKDESLYSDQKSQEEDYIHDDKQFDDKKNHEED